MTLEDHFVKSGTFLFRWRSYLPLLLVPIVILALKDVEYFMGSAVMNEIWIMFCIAIAMCGLFIRVLVVGHAPANTSGRNTRQQRAVVLNTTGMYSVVRHPLYLGNFLMWIGVAAFPHTVWLVGVGLLVFWIYYERIMFAEEAFLLSRFRVQFEDWALRTPAFLPRGRNWQRPSLDFSWKTALAREYSTFFAIIVTFVSLRMTGNAFAGTLPHTEPASLLLLAAGGVIYVVLRTMKKRNLLSVEGR